MPLGFDHAANRGLLVQLCNDRMGDRFAQTPAIRQRLGERAKSTDSVEEPLQPNEGKERGDDDQYWAR
jgi:hypothetical protein